jgi:DNA-binding ferritin-like protein
MAKTIKINKTMKTMKPMKNKNKEYSKIITKSLEFLNNLKLFHWNTRSYSQHMASDELFEELTKKIDTLIESFLQNRIAIKTTISLNTNPSDFLKKIKDFRMCLILADVPYELKSLVDEILIDIDQFEYRLTLKN